MPALRDIDWESIVVTYGPYVWRTAYRILGNPEEASDCFQETFVSAFRVSQRKEINHWPALLRRLAAARAIERLRRRFRESGRRRRLHELADLPGGNPSPPQQAETAELRTRLRQAIARLPKRQAEVFCLRHLESLSNQEIADQLGLKPNAVRISLHRACKRLRGLLEAAAFREER